MQRTSRSLIFWFSARAGAWLLILLLIPNIIWVPETFLDLPRPPLRPGSLPSLSERVARVDPAWIPLRTGSILRALPGDPPCRPPFSRTVWWCSGLPRETNIVFPCASSEIIEKHCVFMLLHPKSLKRVAFSCYFTRHHWNILCFHAISSEIIETHCALMLFNPKSLQNIFVLLYYSPFCALGKRVTSESLQKALQITSESLK